MSTPAHLYGITSLRLYTCFKINIELYTRRRQPTARVPSVARGTIFNGTLSELKYSNYDLIKN